MCNVVVACKVDVTELLRRTAGCVSEPQQVASSCRLSQFEAMSLQEQANFSTL